VTQVTQDVYSPIASLIGQTHPQVIISKEGWPTFVRQDGSCIQLSHEQDCCEDVRLEETIGDLSDLIGYPILQAEVACRDKAVGEEADGECIDEEVKWTFYKLATAKGYVTLRFCGRSNGYYSVSVDIRYFPEGVESLHRYGSVETLAPDQLPSLTAKKVAATKWEKQLLATAAEMAKEKTK
jgi:hypothetical protein